MRPSVANPGGHCASAGDLDRDLSGGTGGCDGRDDLGCQRLEAGAVDAADQHRAGGRETPADDGDECATGDATAIVSHRVDGPRAGAPLREQNA